MTLFNHSPSAAGAPPSVNHRGRSLTSRLLLPSALSALVVLASCARFQQVQYFEVVGDPDPVTGIAPKNYFKMTISGSGGGGVDYKMRAAYVSRATLDSLNGKIPFIPEADMSEENQEKYSKIKGYYLQSLEEYSKQKLDAGATNSRAQEDRILEIARQAWFSSLPDSDLISLGQVKSADPYRFRKLVFYASAANINLQNYDSQINSALDKASTLARLFKKQHDAKKAAKKQRRGHAQQLKLLFPNNPAAHGLIDVLFPATEDENEGPGSAPPELPPNQPSEDDSGDSS